VESGFLKHYPIKTTTPFPTCSGKAARSPVRPQFQYVDRHAPSIIPFPVDDGRTALKQIIESNPLWDKRFQKHHPQCLPQLRTQLGSTNIDSPLDP
jgi:hypothetical protein